MNRTESARRLILICLLLGAVTLAVYWPVSHYAFLNYDDQDYVTANPHVRTGLSWANLAWAFTTTHAGNWHPLAWISHMLDCRLFGGNAGLHHLVNAFLHSTNTLLLFLVLRRFTGATWRSAFVSALFGLHPLHVESVAWVAERKDVLSTFFFVLTLWAYERYAKCRISSARLAVQNGGPAMPRASCPDASTLQRFSAPTIWYLATFVLFALGLMSKPMLVTVPFLLLLLDLWPLRRFDLSAPKKALGTFWPLVLEKVPLLALSAAGGLLTFRAQQQAQYVAELSYMPLGMRLQHALLSYGRYLQKMLWPEGLAVYYPYPLPMPVGAVVLSTLVLVGINVAAILLVRRRPYIAVGWFWYLGTLVPVIGLVQVGLQATADRYTYIPLIGMFVALTWAAADLGQGFKSAKPVLLSAAAVILAASAWGTAVQLRYWRNSESVFRRALAVTGDNPLAHLNLGSALLEQNKFEQGEYHFREVIRLRPMVASAHSNLGFALLMQQKPADAISSFRAALEIDRSLTRTHALLASALLAVGKRDEAVTEYKAALELDPDWLVALNDLAWVLATDPEPRRRDGAQAVLLAERLCRLTESRDPQSIGTLAAAYAEAGRFADAVKSAAQAAELAEKLGQPDRAAKNRELLELYRKGKPYHEADGKSDE